MNKSLKKRIAAIIAALLFLTSASYSQIKDFDYLRSIPSDAVTFTKAYISPWVNAFGSGLSGGWYNTAKPHKLLGFDITTSINVGIAPESAGQFDVSNLKMTTLTGTGLTSSVSGPKSPVANLSVKSGTYTLTSFSAPEGTDFRYVPAPTLQVGIGLPFGTEVKLRYLPTVPIKKADLSLWGVGVMHSLIQYLPGNKLLPFDVSLFAGYTKLTSNIPITLQPESGITQNYSTYNVTTAFKDQKINVTVTGLNVSAVASWNLPVITLYGGVGYTKSATTLNFIGNYPTPTLVSTPAPHTEYNDSGVKTGKDFATQNLSIKNYSGLRANIGLRLKLAILTIHADYTKAQYNVVSLGLGFSFR